jgi:phospholipid/cholesterol/gamma-HCH transport system substrate-binding protein
MTGRRRVTALALAALVAAVVAVVVISIGPGSSSYVVKAQFLDAGQLVTGGLVQVGGRKVGEITAIRLTDNGLAEVEMTIDDDSARPLHQGTRAAIRTAGLSGVANRFVDLTPGPPSTAPIPDGGVLPPTQTRGVVDLDAVLNSFDPALRRDFRGIIRDASVALTARTARQANAGLEMLNPAVSQLTELGRELTRDEAALRSLLTHTASVSDVLARHRSALGSGIDATGGVLESVASERAALADALDRAPESLRLTTRTLRRLRTSTLPALDPLLRRALPAVKPLAEVLRVVRPTLRHAQPVMRRLRVLLPAAQRVLAPLPGQERAASPALASGTKALGDALPSVAGLRPYTPDLVSGLFLGFGGSTTASYDANGHYMRVYLEAGTGSLPGLVPPGDLGSVRHRVEARCPGAAEEPAPDGSNPWPEGGGDSCDPGDGHP